MPNVTLVREHLFDAIGKQYTDAEFDELCFEFGVEVDDVETQVVEFTVDGLHIKEEHVVYVIAIPANRYDLLCMEGFARAIRIFIGKDTPPVRLVPPSPQTHFHLHLTPHPTPHPSPLTLHPSPPAEIHSRRPSRRAPVHHGGAFGCGHSAIRGVRSSARG